MELRLDPDETYIVQVAAIIKNLDNSWSFPSEVKTGRLGSPYFQEVAIVENTVSLSWMPPGGDKIVTGYKLYIADELGKDFKITVLFIGLATRTEFLTNTLK